MTNGEAGEDKGRGELYPHQKATAAWMAAVEAVYTPEENRADTVCIDTLEFAGVVLGGSYDAPLPCGGVIGHPPGSGKTRIVAAHIAAHGPPPEGVCKAPPLPKEIWTRYRRSAQLLPGQTLVVCPGHLCKQWTAELALMGALEGTTVLAQDALPGWDRGDRYWSRLVVDEPQDFPQGIVIFSTSLIIHITINDNISINDNIITMTYFSCCYYY